MSIDSTPNSEQLKSDIKKLLFNRKAVLISHYYTDHTIQSLTEETGGYIGDSLEMARFGMENEAQTLLVCGVKFMGETAKILSPNKKVLVADINATCSLDISCPATKFKDFCAKNSDHTVVVYANTSAAVKACADWVVTSSIAVDLIDSLTQEGKKILWAPDKYLGSYIQQKLSISMLMWDGACIVHEEFKAQGIKNMQAVYPQAAVLVHPESPPDVIALADKVGSTTQLIQAAKSMPHDTFIVATDKGIFYKMSQAAPHKKFISAPTAGEGAKCKACSSCPWMAMNSIESVYTTLTKLNNEINIPENIIQKATIPLNKMMGFNVATT